MATAQRLEDRGDSDGAARVEKLHRHAVGVSMRQRMAKGAPAEGAPKGGWRGARSPRGGGPRGGRGGGAPPRWRPGGGTSSPSARAAAGNPASPHGPIFRTTLPP